MSTATKSLNSRLRNFEESAKPDLFLKRENVVDDWISADNKEAFSVVTEVLKKTNF